MRSFRTSVHEVGLGYVGYLQMSSDVGDYARYVLIKLDRLAGAAVRSTFGFGASPSLHLRRARRVAAGRCRGKRSSACAPQRSPPADLSSFVGGLVDRLSRVPALASADSDLLQALLLLQRRDPALRAENRKFLRCESLTGHEQQLLGGLAPRLQPEDPGRTLEQIGQLAFALDDKALVLLLDQIEDAIPDGRSHERVQRAIDVLRRIADAVPSTVIVLACLDDIYEGSGAS